MMSRVTSQNVKYTVMKTAGIFPNCIIIHKIEKKGICSDKGYSKRLEANKKKKTEKFKDIKGSLNKKISFSFQKEMTNFFQGWLC